MPTLVLELPDAIVAALNACAAAAKQSPEVMAETILSNALPIHVQDDEEPAKSLESLVARIKAMGPGPDIEPVPVRPLPDLVDDEDALSPEEFDRQWTQALAAVRRQAVLGAARIARNLTSP